MPYHGKPNIRHSPYLQSTSSLPLALLPLTYGDQRPYVHPAKQMPDLALIGNRYVNHPKAWRLARGDTFRSHERRLTKQMRKCACKHLRTHSNA